MKEKRVCLNCGYELKGRADQKFCSDSCRNAYNNEQNSDANNFVRKVNRVLRKNRKILEKLCPYEKSKSTKAQLSGDGFNFKYHTNKYLTKKGQEYIFCYDYGYLELEGGELVIVKRKDYVD
jgi:predicted nucleic acid-binding Zn ribbon protein